MYEIKTHNINSVKNYVNNPEWMVAMITIRRDLWQIIAVLLTGPCGVEEYLIESGEGSTPIYWWAELELRTHTRIQRHVNACQKETPENESNTSQGTVFASTIQHSEVFRDDVCGL